MGEVEENVNLTPLIEDIKKAIIDFINREYEEDHKYEDFNNLYPDLNTLVLPIQIHQMKTTKYSLKLILKI